MLLEPTDLLESNNEDITFSIFLFCQRVLQKKEILHLFLRKSEKCLSENEILSLNIKDYHWIGNSVTVRQIVLDNQCHLCPRKNINWILKYIVGF